MERNLDEFTVGKNRRDKHSLIEAKIMKLFVCNNLNKSLYKKFFEVSNKRSNTEKRGELERNT